MTVSAGLYVLRTVALSLSLLHAQLVPVQSSVEYEDRNAAAVKEHYYGVAWCRSPTATKSQGQRYLVDPLAFEVPFQSLEETP